MRSLAFLATLVAGCAIAHSAVADPLPPTSAPRSQPVLLNPVPSATPEAAPAPAAAPAPVAPAPVATPRTAPVTSPPSPVTATETPAPKATAATPPLATKVQDATRPVPAKAAAPSLIVRIDLSKQKLDVQTGGTTIHSWPISSGREGYPTPRGIFRAQWMAKLWHSQKYDLAPMPHSIFFKDGAAIHGTQSTGLLGRPASHGCVRLAPANAARLYGLVQKHGLKQTQIQVFGTPPPSRVAKRAPGPDFRTALPPRHLQRHPGMADHLIPSRRPGAHPGMVHLPPGSPYAGRTTFMHNGVLYVRVR